MGEYARRLALDAVLGHCIAHLFGNHNEARRKKLLKKRPRREPWKFSAL